MDRRGNGEGSITRRKDGLYMARYTIQSEIGAKRKAIYARTRKGAAEKLAEALTNRDKGLLFDAESLTVGAYLSRWLNDSVRGSVKPVTFASYAGLVKKHIIPTVA
jgi:integrase